MKWTFDYREDSKFIRVTGRGVFTAEAHARMVEELIAQPFWRRGIPVLFDNRKINFSTGGEPAIRAAGEFHIENDARIGDGKAALLMSSVADFGLGRQYELTTDEEISVNVHVFLDENQAIRWLEM